MEKIGIIAGCGVFPLRVAESLRRLGKGIAVAAIRGEASHELEEIADDLSWFHVGQVGRIIRYFRQAGVRKAVMAGKVHKHRMYAWKTFLPGRVDLKAVRLWLSLRRNRADDTLLGALAAEFGREGVEIEDSTLYVPDLLARKGTMGRREPRPRQGRDIEIGFRVAKELGRVDIGQSVAVKNGAVVAVEAMEGTDRMIRRAGEIAGAGIVVVKTAKPKQDLRFDVPTIGPDTVKTLAEAKGAVLAVEAGKTLVMDREEMVRRADEEGIAVVAV